MIVSRIRNRKLLISEIRIVDWSRAAAIFGIPGLLPFSRERQYRQPRGARVAPNINNVCMHTSVHATRFASPFIFGVARRNFRRSARGCAINYREGYRVGRERGIVIMLGVIIMFRY